MPERKDIEELLSFQELIGVGAKLRPGMDPKARAYDPLERYRSIPNHAIFLYTSEDPVLDSYIRNHWAALDGLSGQACDIYVSMVQLCGGADAYSQMHEIRSLPGLSSIEPSDLPALHIWSSKSNVTLSLVHLRDDDALRDAFRWIFTEVGRSGGPISIDTARGRLVCRGSLSLFNCTGCEHQAQMVVGCDCNCLAAFW
jgi:hypothetical protein